MMMSQWTGMMVLVVLAVVSSTAAIRCFHCSDCGDSAGTPEECSSSYDVCMKIDLAGHIEKTCGKKAACSLGSIERGVVSVWNNLKNWISDVDEDHVVSDDAEAKVIKCCEEDLCNSSVSKLMNPFLLLLPLLMYLVRY